jgi:hypothetical protein
VERNIGTKWDSGELSEGVEGRYLARNAKMPAQLEDRKKELGIYAGTNEH